MSECECGRKPGQSCANPDCHQPVAFFFPSAALPKKAELMKMHDETVQVLKDWVGKT